MKRWCRTATTGLLFAAGLWFCSSAYGMPLVALEVHGDCPGRTDIESAGMARGLSIGSSGVTVAARSVPNGVDFSLISSNGVALLTRHIESQDCRALAEAIVVVVETAFVEMEGARSAAVTQTGTSEPLRGEQSATTAKSPGVSTAQAPRQVSAGADTVRLLSEHSFGVRQAVTSTAPQLSMTFGGGLATSLPGGDLLPVLTVGQKLELPRARLSLQVRLASSPPLVERQGTERISRWANQALFQLGFTSGASWELMPWIGGGVALERLRALDWGDVSARLGISPIIASGIGTGWDFSPRWRGWVELSAQLYVVRHIYAVSSEGEIGRGPRGALMIQSGVSLGNAR